MSERYNSFGAYAKKLFGGRVHKVNIDAGFTCPNRDGTLGRSGCIYCNNDSFRPTSCKPSMGVAEQVQNGMRYIKSRYGAGKFLAYFQPYTNTYAPVDVLERLYSEALADPAVIGLAIGTRPDCVDEEKLDMIAAIATTHFVLIEYGLQSIYEKSLRFINRGHGLDAFLNALAATRQRNIHAGAHLIVGFPTETRDETLEMASYISETGIEFLKVHQLQVIKNTPLAGIYRETQFPTFGYEEYLDFIVEFVSRLAPEIVLQRLFATAPDDILIAPEWGRSRHEILLDINRRFETRDATQGMFRKAGTRS